MAKATKKQMKTMAIIGVAIVVALSGLLGYLVWNTFMGNRPHDVTSELSLDQVPEYGACNLVTRDTIKNTFNGDRIIQLNEGVRIGEMAVNDTIAEGCRYAFSTADSNNNSLTVYVYDYTSVSNGVDKEAVGDEWSEVGGSDPIAYFNQTEKDGVTISSYRILPGSKNILVTLRQPSNAATYTQDEAFDFIGGIASKLSLESINNTAGTPAADIDGESSGPSNTTPGAITDNP